MTDEQIARKVAEDAVTRLFNVGRFNRDSEVWIGTLRIWSAEESNDRPLSGDVQRRAINVVEDVIVRALAMRADTPEPGTLHAVFVQDGMAYHAENCALCARGDSHAAGGA